MGDVDLTVVTLVLDASDQDPLLAVLARYVVMARRAPGCRNIDLCASSLKAGQFIIIQKWDSVEARQAHFDSPEMAAFAAACRGLLARPPDIGLYDALSAHDLV